MAVAVASKGGGVPRPYVTAAAKKKGLEQQNRCPPVLPDCGCRWLPLAAAGCCWLLLAAIGRWLLRWPLVGWREGIHCQFSLTLSQSLSSVCSKGVRPFPSLPLQCFVFLQAAAVQPGRSAGRSSSFLSMSSTTGNGVDLGSWCERDDEGRGANSPMDRRQPTLLPLFRSLTPFRPGSDRCVQVPTEVHEDVECAKFRFRAE